MVSQNCPLPWDYLWRTSCLCRCTHTMMCTCTICRVKQEGQRRSRVPQVTTQFHNCQPLLPINCISPDNNCEEQFFQQYTCISKNAQFSLQQILGNNFSGCLLITQMPTNSPCRSLLGSSRTNWAHTAAWFMFKGAAKKKRGSIFFDTSLP